MIKLNEDFRDDGQQYSAQIRLRIEMLVLTLEDIQGQRQRLARKICKCLSLREVKKLLATMNKAYHYLHELEDYINQESRKPC